MTVGAVAGRFVTEPNRQLDDVRRQIDALDEQIVCLLNQRAGLVLDIGRLKAEAGIATYRPDREREVLDRVKAGNTGPLAERTLLAIYRELMSGSFSLEKPPRIAYLGPAGSYSHVAATRKFGATVEYEPLRHIDALFGEVEREHVDLAVVPIENTSGGGVVDSLDAFARHDVKVCAEIYLAVHHHLLGNLKLEEVRRVYSKAEVFPQCLRFLTDCGLIDKTIGVASTSAAAQQAASEPGAAAIGNELAAELFGLGKICDRIEDDPQNTTRFLVIGQSPAQPTGRDKTSLVFRAADRPGALVDVLDVFRQAQVNMTYIESRPGRVKKWEYAFFIDVEGHASDPVVEGAIEKIRPLCSELRVLGSFPRADEVL
ncbi:MAG: prephenate dehydratase [Phycisphaerae bacterium]|nr:prephenate dehydratase [Phycisphaerae bacterium]